MTESPLARAALAFTRASERWLPDSFVFALLATFVVVAAALATGAPAVRIVDAWGRGFWDLAAFTTQMAMIIIAGYVLASSPPILALIRKLAGVPKSARGAVALVAFAALASSWLNWGFSLIFSAVLAREVARRVRADYRALAAASFVGLGSVWAQGLSGSAALQMASPELLPKSVRAIVAAGGSVPGGVIPLRHTIFLWQSQLAVLVEVIVVVALLWAIAPTERTAKTAADLGIALDDPAAAPPAAKAERTLGDALERSPALTILATLLGAAYLVHRFAAASDRLAAIDLPTLLIAFLTLGFALHGTPARMLRAVREATPAVWGVLLQFPFYAGILGVITGTGLNDRLAHLFTRVATPTTYPPFIAIYSALLGVFVPSGGSKWAIEAPYVLESAHQLHVHLGWTVACYDLGEALANLIQPFWMLPILGLLKLRARDVMGYTFLVFLVLVPIVLAVVTLLGMTLKYPL